MAAHITIRGPEADDPTAQDLNARYDRINWAHPGAGSRPEPYVDREVLGVIVPVAPSWIRLAGRAEHAMVARMLAELPGRRLTCITGWPEYPGSWQASNDGPDGWGSWVIDWPSQRPPRRWLNRLRRR